MPGKYPTINSRLTTRTVLEPGGTLGLSESNQPTLRAMFPNSPIYTLTAAEYRATAAGYLMPTVQRGDTDQFGLDGVNMDYAGSPNLSDPASGPLARGFDSPYYPNLIANPDPIGGEGTATGAPLAANDNFGTGASVDNVLPSATAAIINQTTINVDGSIAPLGKSGANLSTGTVTTHSINDGALDDDPTPPTTTTP
jgi:hypothetical protein